MFPRPTARNMHIPLEDLSNAMKKEEFRLPQVIFIRARPLIHSMFY